MHKNYCQKEKQQSHSSSVAYHATFNILMKHQIEYILCQCQIYSYTFSFGSSAIENIVGDIFSPHPSKAPAVFFLILPHVSVHVITNLW